MIKTQYLSPEGEAILDELREHCTKYKMEEVYEHELAMLANSFDIHAKMSKFCLEHGYTQNPKEGGWAQVRPEYTVMKNEHQNILKHSGKFGLNPEAMLKLFKGGKTKKKVFA